MTQARELLRTLESLRLTEVVKYEMPWGEYLIKPPFAVNKALVTHTLKANLKVKVVNGRMPVLGVMGKTKTMGIRYYDEHSLDKIIDQGYDELDKDGKWYPLLVIETGHYSNVEALTEDAYDRHMAAGQEAVKPLYVKLQAIKDKMEPIMDKQHQIYVKYNGENSHDIHPGDFEQPDADAYHKLEQDRIALRDKSTEIRAAIKRLKDGHETKALAAHRASGRRALSKKYPHLVKR